MYSKSNMPEQSKKLLTMLSYVITKFNKPEDITGEEKTYQTAPGLQYTAAHYTTVDNALI